MDSTNFALQLWDSSMIPMLRASKALKTRLSFFYYY
jgi:hypothetical protein